MRSLAPYLRVLKVGAAVVVAVVVLGITAMVALGYRNLASRPGATTTGVAGEAASAAGAARRDSYRLRDGIASKTDMGDRKKTGRPMPHKALPHQAVHPCQDEEKELYGSCWMGPFKGIEAPCPPNLYQEAGECYAPVAADPNVPLGAATQAPCPEGR
jgi:hypothetical protein